MTLDIIPYLTIITAIVAAYLTYRNQLRLKTFELLHERKKSVLLDIEGFLKNLYQLRADIDGEDQRESVSDYLREHFHEGLILFHKVKGANFGSISDNMANTFWSVITEPSKKSEGLTKDEAKEWIIRTTNVLSALYAFSHSQLTKDLEGMAFSPIYRFIKKRKKKVKVKVEKKSQQNHQADS